MSIAPAPDLSGSCFPLSAVCPSSLGTNIHVWTLPAYDHSSPAGKSQYDHWLGWLSTDELDRASRFHFAHHAVEFVSNRARLRGILGHYLEIDPKQLQFNYSPLGKPSLKSGSADLSFNLSHTDGLALVAIAKRGRLGIDIEISTPATDAMELARQNFSPAEVRALEAYPVAEQQAAFLRCWTRKEAFLKALGAGLSRPLSEFSVTCDPDNPLLLDCSWDRSAPDHWKFLSLTVDAGYTAALACEQNLSRSDVAVITHTWSQE